MDKIKVAALNLYLGLKNKKDEVKRPIFQNNINVLCLQESKILCNYPVEVLMFSGYGYENEINNIKARCGIYVSNLVWYVR